MKYDESITDEARIFESFRVLDRAVSRSDVLEACRTLIRKSDEFRHAKPSFDPAEIESIAGAIFPYIFRGNEVKIPAIQFKVLRPLHGDSLDMDCLDYASIYSKDMVYQNCLTSYTDIELEELRQHLKIFLVSMLFHHRYCQDTITEGFRLYFVKEYTVAVETLLSKEGRSSALGDALFITLQAFSTIEGSLKKLDDETRLSKLWA